MTRDEEAFSEIKAAMNHHTVRITVSVGFGISGSVPTARIETPGTGKRWKKRGPLLVPAEGEDRKKLMLLLADLVDEEVTT